MKRQEAREIAFLILFESNFKDEGVAEIINNAKEARDTKINSFSQKLIDGVINNKDTIDSLIEEASIKWQKRRISNVAISVMRLAIYEMIYEKDIPNGVSINEAVEITKKYSTKEEASFVNGVLGSISKKVADGNA